MDISSYIQFLGLQINEIEPLMKKIISEHESQILRIIRTRLYQKGIDGDGNEILPEYAFSTIIEKKNKTPRQITNHVTLRDTGSFYAGMSVEYSNGFIYISSSVNYEDELTEKYGDSILKLTDDELQVVINSMVEPELLKRLDLNKQITIDF